jgi:hypothetical protein
MNNHAATYNPNGKKYREQAEKGAIGRTAYLQAKSYEDVFVNAAENRRWGLSRLPPQPPPPPASPQSPWVRPTAGEKEEDDGNAAQWREGDEADAGGNRGEDAGRRERG